MLSSPVATNSSTRPNKRRRVHVACSRCKSRRQKCDNQFPACSNCAKAKLNCTFEDNEYPASYIKDLENRVVFLEGQVTSSRPSPSRDQLVSESSRVIAVVSDGTSARVATPSSNNAPNLASSVGLLSLHAGADPQYFGVSSGVSLARMLELAVHENARPYSLSLQQQETAESPFSSTTSEVQIKPGSLPSSENGTIFLKAYLSYIQPNFPFIPKTKLWEIHRDSRELEKLSTDEARNDLIIILLVYAIGSRCLQLVGSPNVSAGEPESYYHFAISKFHDNSTVASIQNIQITLLVAIYALRSQSKSSIWDLCSLMIRQCLQLGFHRQLKTDEKSTELDEFKKRLFWSTYSLERRTSLVLGRPLAISDDEIDVEFPQNTDEDLTTSSPEGLDNGQDSNNRLLPAGPQVAQTDISFHVLVLMLDQLNSKNRLTLCRLAKLAPSEKIERKIAKRFQELENWKTSIFGSNSEFHANDPKSLIFYTSRTPVHTPESQPTMPETQRLALMLNYHRARRLILQAMLTDIQLPNHNFPFSSFAKSSGEVCQLNRRLHRLKPVPFTLLDLHSVFVAGLSMIYCAWKNPQLYDAEMAADFGACSTVLYLIAEQWGAGAKKYRDAFELGAEKTAEHVLSLKRASETESQENMSEQQSYTGSTAVAGQGMQESDIQNQNNHYSNMGSAASAGWANDNFDVWQMMSDCVQTHDDTFGYSPVGFTGIEQFMAEQSTWWFNGST